ncbi:MAG: glycerophosphodiester phosphodiesterase [Candidatus Thiodiazotropha sp. (ex Monitilora ramsayi)]|nr:glycerophosphodiester phosphodiesterase [Candidatus Thiodiazotropha sp. (ex Monitilora ramsayi)]
MSIQSITFVTAILLTAGCIAGNHQDNDHEHNKRDRHRHWEESEDNGVQLGPRPSYLINDMDDSELKRELLACDKEDFEKSDFSIGHRGAAMQFPEHTKESYVAAARMGAGILECDVTFTKDRELVCRHSQCDLHTTTNILATPLAEKCSQPFVPAHYDADGNWVKASAKCCTSDITLEEFKTLKGKMDAANANATSVEEYLDATPSWRTDLYTGTGTLMTHAESIELFKQLDAKMTPELKSPSVAMPFQGDYTQQDYAQQMIDEYKAAGVKPKHVFAQSFNLNDVLYWIEQEPRFGKQAVYIDGNYDNLEATIDMMSELADKGVNYLAPAMWALVTVVNGEIVPSEYAIAAKANGFNLITWTLERSGLLAGGGGWYYQTTTDVIDNDGDMMVLLDVLAQDVGIKGIFSDWPATVTYYANCKDL